MVGAGLGIASTALGRVEIATPSTSQRPTLLLLILGGALAAAVVVIIALIVF